MRTILRTGLLLSALLALVLGVKAAEKKKLTCTSVEGQYTFVTVWVDGEEEYPIDGEEDIYEITPNAKVELQIEVGAEGKIIDEVKIGASLFLCGARTYKGKAGEMACKPQTTARTPQKSAEMRKKSDWKARPTKKC